VTGAAPPLAGVRIVELGQYIAVPAATQVLADMGADVVKVEPPRGEQARYAGAYGAGMIRVYNRGKRSVCLDLQSPSGREQMLALLAHADAFVQNLRPGALDRLGLGAEVVRAANPRLVQVNLSGYPYDSPSASRPGLDIAAQAEGGMMSVTGDPDRDPVRVGFAVVDSAASYAVVQAVLAGVLRAGRTGTGGLVDVSLLEVAVHLQSAMWGEWSVTGELPVRRGNGQATVAPAADLVATSDGHVVVSAYIQEHFARLCTVLGRPKLADDPRFADNSARVRNRAALRAELSAGLGTLSSAEAVALLQRNGIVAGAVLDYQQVAGSPDVRDSAILASGTTEDGASFCFPRLPMRFDRRPGPVHDRVAALGEWGAAAVAGAWAEQAS
jgi:crotonobetainyl-CoA:carnitine CoA-transferase CaiB-like acyl-CoA transferase